MRVRARVSKVNVHQQEIASIFGPAGRGTTPYSVGDSMRGELPRIAQQELARRGSVRSGRLGASMKAALTRGWLELWVALYSTSEVAKWYHEGTRPWITGRSGPMKVPQNRKAPFAVRENPGQPYFLANRVRGQRGKPFMSDALDRSARRHGL